MSEGVLAAAGTIAAGAAILYGTGAFEKDDDACKGVQENLKAALEKAQSSNKLTDASAAARAAAMAEYACKYYSAVKVNARNNMIIALIQQAASFYFADKQHDVAKQAQNRFDEICLFKPLSKTELLQIVELILNNINQTLAPQKIKIHLSDLAKTRLIDAGYDPAFGARPLKRVVSKTVENIIAKANLSGEIQSGDTLEITEAQIEAELVQ